MEAIIAAAVVLLALTLAVSLLAGVAKFVTVVKERRTAELAPASSLDLAGAES